MAAGRGLSPRASNVLRLIARGLNYEQILARNPELTYMDIFRAAEEALRLGGGEERRGRFEEGGPRGRFEEGPRPRPARAYEPWTDEDDARLRAMIEEGKPGFEIAREQERFLGEVRNRAERLGLELPFRAGPLRERPSFGRGGRGGGRREDYGPPRRGGFRDRGERPPRDRERPPRRSEDGEGRGE